MKYLLTAILILTAATVCSSQTANDQLKECSQFLQKATDAARTCRQANEDKQKVIDAQDKQIEGLKFLLKKQEELSQKYIDRLEKVIERLEAVKCSKTYFLFGLIKTKRCY